MINEDFATRFVTQMCNYVDFNKSGGGIVDTQKIESHYKVTTKHFTPTELAEFKGLVQEVAGKTLMSSGKIIALPEIATANQSNLVTAFKTALQNPQHTKLKGTIEVFGKFMCSFSVYMKWIMAPMLILGLFSLGIFGKSNNKDSDTSA